MEGVGDEGLERIGREEGVRGFLVRNSHCQR